MSYEPADAPLAFRRAVASLRAAAVPPLVAIREIPAPVRLAPYAFALATEVRAGDDDLATGRFIVLHDPDGQEAWDGDTRVVGFITAAVEDEIGNDPMLADVGWAWLLDGLAVHGARYHAEGGTVTRTSSARFGAMAGQPGGCDIELRCSWTPHGGDDLSRHLAAFCDVMRSMAGLPPLAPGVAQFPLSRPAS